MLINVNPVRSIREFFQCAKSPGKYDKGITQLNKFLFPDDHILNDFQMRHSRMGLFFINEYFRNYTGHRSTCCQGGICRNSHKAQAASAKQHGVTFSAQTGAEFSRELRVFFPFFRPGSAVYRDCLWLCHICLRKFYSS